MDDHFEVASYVVDEVWVAGATELRTDGTHPVIIVGLQTGEDATTFRLTKEQCKDFIRNCIITWEESYGPWQE